MIIKRIIAQTLTACLCRNKTMRKHLLTTLSKKYKTSLIHETFQSCMDDACRIAFIDHPEYTNHLLQRLTETLNNRSLTDTECALLAHAANAAFHYSQEGEDIILDRFLSRQDKGFYVDVGAHHPTRFSNTYALYRRGWRGINIDATPGSMTAFIQWRPHDINIETAVSDTNQPLAFHMFTEPALNTFDAGLAETYIQNGWERQETRDIMPRSLKDILDEHMPPDTPIDIMNIDVEGGELGALRSNDWGKYVPQYVILEVLDANFADIMNQPAPAFLGGLGYVPVAKLVQSLILRKS